MAEIRVNPTRMELKKLQARYLTARRGHKLLKDKRDELMRQFLDVVREDKALRRKVEKALAVATGSLSVAGAVGTPRMMEEALILPKKEAEILVNYRNCMSVNVPEFEVRYTGSEGDSYNYGLATTPAELDAAVGELGNILPDLLRMAELEKRADLLAGEIERTRRRVNALEYIMMPQYERAIHNIKMKLDENERGNITRLMKVKDMMLEASIKEKHSFIPDEPEEEV